MIWIYFTIFSIVNLFISYKYFNFTDKYLVVSFLSQSIIFFRSSSIIGLLLMTLVTFILNLIALEDDLHYSIRNKYIIILLILGILRVAISSNYYYYICGFLLGIVSFLVFIAAEKILNKEIIGGGDLKLIVALGLLTGKNVLLICCISGLIAILRNKKSLGAGFLSSVFFL